MVRVTDPTDVGGVPTVEIVVAEAFDLEAVPRLHALLDDALALKPRELVVDLTSCPWLDAAAIGLLLDVHRRARRAGSVLTLRSPSTRLQRNLKLARVDQVIPVKPRLSTSGEASDNGPSATGTADQEHA